MQDKECDVEMSRMNKECFEAEKQYKTFLNYISQKDNKLIEESIIIRILNLVLSYDESYTFLNGERLYRARKIYDDDLNIKKGIDLNNEKFIGFDKYQSKEAPITLGSEGRNNVRGMPYIYLAGDKYTAIAELKESDFSYISLALFKVNHRLKLLDFTDIANRVNCKNICEQFPNENIGDIFVERILYKMKYQFSNPLEWTNGYLASQYIADYVRKQGIDGIMYRSSCTDGINYTIFNSGNNNIEFINSKITFIHSRKYTIIDLETNGQIEPETSLELNDEFIKEVQKNIKNKYLKNARKEADKNGKNEDANGKYSR